MTLFLLAINDIVENIELLVKCCLFADDLTIYCTGHDINITHDIIQKSLNKLQLWSLTTGIKFLSNKTEFIIFTKSTEPVNVQPLFLNNQEIQQVEHLKILGKPLDKKMNWRKHLELLRSKTQNNLKLIKTIAAKNCGADSQLLINTYKTTILSKLDYGAILYDSSK